MKAIALTIYILLIHNIGLVFSQIPFRLKINPKATIACDFSDLFEEVRFIPLETTKKSVFGTISRLIVTDELFVISDHSSSNSVLIFDKKGIFKGRISGGKDVILPITSFDRKAQLIKCWFLPESSIPPKVFSNALKDPIKVLEMFKKYAYTKYFDPYGNEKVLKKVNEDIQMDLARFPMKNDKVATSFFMADNSFSDSTGYQLKILDKKGEVAVFFPYNMKKDVAMCGKGIGEGQFFATENDSSFLFTRPLDYNIYRYGNGVLRTIANFVFPLVNTIPALYFSDTNLTAFERRSKYLTDNSVITQVTDTYLFGNYLYFKTNANGQQLIYNAANGSLYSINKVASDQLCFGLPLFKALDNCQTILTRKGEYLYSFISANNLFLSHKLNKLKDKISYPGEIDSFLRNGSADLNPVIVLLKPRKN